MPVHAGTKSCAVHVVGKRFKTRIVSSVSTESSASEGDSGTVGALGLDLIALSCKHTRRDFGVYSGLTHFFSVPHEQNHGEMYTA